MLVRGTKMHCAKFVVIVDERGMVGNVRRVQVHIEGSAFGLAESEKLRRKCTKDKRKLSPSLELAIRKICQAKVQKLFRLAFLFGRANGKLPAIFLTIHFCNRQFV